MKIKLFLMLALSLFFIFVKTSFAQSPQDLFNMSTPAIIQKITAATHKAPQPVAVSPFTTVIIPYNSFSGDVTMYAYNGIWDKVKPLLPKDQSPINSFYFVFKDSNNQIVTPKIPVIIQTVNNYIGTNSYFYPLNNSGIDTANQKEKTGHVTMNISLPVGDSGFISAANKIINPNDSSLNPVFVSTAPIAPSSGQTIGQQGGLLSPALFPLTAVLVLVLAAILITVWITLNKRKKRSK